MRIQFSPQLLLLCHVLTTDVHPSVILDLQTVVHCLPDRFVLLSTAFFALIVSPNPTHTTPIVRGGPPLQTTMRPPCPAVHVSAAKDVSRPYFDEEMESLGLASHLPGEIQQQAGLRPEGTEGQRAHQAHRQGQGGPESVQENVHFAASHNNVERVDIYISPPHQPRSYQPEEPSGRLGRAYSRGHAPRPEPEVVGRLRTAVVPVAPPRRHPAHAPKFCVWFAPAGCRMGMIHGFWSPLTSGTLRSSAFRLFVPVGGMRRKSKV